MFSEAIVAYLFLGGVGGGVLVVLSAIELVVLGHRNTVYASDWYVVGGLSGGRGAAYDFDARLGIVPEWNLASRAFSDEDASESSGGFLSQIRSMLRISDEALLRSWVACLLLFFLGILFLFFDLGRPDRLVALASHPALSPISIGAWALGIGLLCALFGVVRAWFDPFRVPDWIVRIVYVVGLASGVVTLCYTGVLLSSLSSVVFWMTPLLPVVFSVSSLSCGFACVFACTAFSNARISQEVPILALMKVDSLLIVIELVCLAGWVVMAYADPAAQPAAHALVAGELSGPFWLALVLVGLVVPLGLERFARSSLLSLNSSLLWLSALILIGGFALRYCVVCTGCFDVSALSFMSAPNI